MTKKLQLLPKGLNSFEKMITNDYVYVDKTKHIYDIITNGSYYFLARPRRFGKSLLVSTCSMLFTGKKELFKGLWIEKSDYDWRPHPVIHLSLVATACSSAQSVRDDLIWQLEQVAAIYSVDISKAPSLETKFKSLVVQLAKTDSGVVILIDEYDHPIIKNINNSELAVQCRDVLRDFFGVIKDLDDYLKFVLITGVSKFSKTSIFSGLNNLEDLTVSERGATLLGYTPDELTTYFEPYLKKVAKQNNVSYEKIIEQTKLWYDGYQFCENPDKNVYNPYSVLLFLDSGKYLNYWFETGTPTFLLDLIRTKNYPVTNLDDIRASADELGTIEVDDIPITPLLFQTGYLTIDSYNPATKNYHLKLPNLEVKESFLKYLLKQFTKITLGGINEFALQLTNTLEANDVDQFCQLMQVFFADIPSGIQIPRRERYYQSILFVLAKILGLTVNVEIMTNIGRIDLTIETAKHVYIFEFKMDGSPEKALHQIEEKKYYQKYLMASKKIVLVGVLFDIEKRNIDSWVVKKIN